MSVSKEYIQQLAQEAAVRIMTIAVRDRLDVGETVGLYQVKVSDPRRLRLQVGNGMMLTLFVVGVVFTALNVWLFNTGWIHWARLLPVWWKGALIGLPIVGLFSILMLGRSFEFAQPADGGSVAGTAGVLVRKRWLWFFGPAIDPGRVAAVGVLVRPGYSSTSADRIEVRILDPSGKVVLEVEDAEGDVAKDVGAALTLAVQLGEVLGKPVQVEGEPKEMGEYARDAVRRFREKVGAAG